MKKKQKNKILKKRKHMTPLQRRNMRNKVLERRLQGYGRFIYQNRHNATLGLPKVSLDGKKSLAPFETFEGDDYFMSLVPTDLRLVQIICSAEEAKKKMAADKLILDQPDQVNAKGKVEHVIVPDNNIPLHENTPSPKNPKKDDPMDGVKIILG